METLNVEFRVRDSFVDKLLEMIKSLPKSEVEVDIKEDKSKEFKINTKECLNTLGKIKKGELSEFEEIIDIDKHIRELRSEIN